MSEAITSAGRDVHIGDVIHGADLTDDITYLADLTDDVITDETITPYHGEMGGDDLIHGGDLIDDVTLGGDPGDDVTPGADITAASPGRDVTSEHDDITPKDDVISDTISPAEEQPLCPRRDITDDVIAHVGPRRGGATGRGVVSALGAWSPGNGRG